MLSISAREYAPDSSYIKHSVGDVIEVFYRVSLSRSHYVVVIYP